MASPTVAGRFEGNLTTAGTSLTVTFDTSPSAGDLLIVFLGWPAAGPGTITFTGYTRFDPTAGTVSGWWYRQADGTEGASDDVTWTTSSKVAMIGYRITGHENPGTQAPQCTTNATGSTNTPDAGSISPTGGSKDYLFITGFRQAGEEADDDTWVTATPSGYSNTLQKTTDVAGAVSVNCQVATAERQATTATENAGAFTTAQTIAWTANTIAVHPAATVITPPKPTLISFAVQRSWTY